jgi:hypothetical protein
VTDKLKNWSEGHNRTMDAMHGLGSDLLDEAVDETVARRGVLWLTNCTFCGRQWKGIVVWPEVASYYLLESVTSPGGEPLVQYTKQGVLTLNPCNGCGKTFRVIVDYDEIRRWVDSGVRNGYLSPRIHEAAASRRTQR